jgi:Tfp pilus assembly protein PilN
MRTGRASYILLGALALVLLGVVATALTSRQISDRESEKQSLQQELDVATARAQSLQTFADFRVMQEARVATVSSLAQSRFDWERVLRELSLVLPDNVWLTNLTGTVSPAVEVEDSAAVALRDTVSGPALELVGCGPGQDAVAAFVASLEDIDGVTRVGVAASELPDESQDPEAAAPQQGAGNTEDCRTRDFISRFEIVVAFDAVPTPPTATEAPGVPATLMPDDGAQQVAEAQSQQAVATDSAGQQVQQGQQATDNLIPGG